MPDVADLAEMISAFAAVISVFFLAFQIRKSSEIAKSDFTFHIIEKLESFLIKNDENPQCIHNVLAYDEDKGIREGDDFYDKVFELRFSDVYIILNFFEKLSLAYETKALNRKTLIHLYGYRILEQYRKLKPLIIIIQGKEEKENGINTSYVPYQNFNKFAEELESKYRKKENSIRQQAKTAGIIEKIAEKIKLAAQNKRDNLK